MISVRMSVAAAVTAGTLLMTGVAAGQVDEMAKRVLQDSAAALGRLQSLEFSARRYGEGQISIIDFTGEVKLVRPAPDRARCPMLVKGHSKGLGTQPDTFWYSLDGNGKISVVDEPNKKVYMDWPLERRTPWMNQKSAGDQVLHEVFFQTEPYKGELTSDRLELKPSTEFKGARCDVVVATRNLPGGKGTSVVTWYIGSDDRLPRRQHQSVQMGTDPIVMVYEAWDMRGNTGLKPADVRLEPPAGMAVEVYREEAPPVTPNQAQQPPVAPVEPVKLGVEEGNVPPDFALKTAEGSTVKRDDLKGHVTVLAFLWSKNTPSAKSVAVLNELLEANKGVKVYAVMSHEKSDADATKFMSTNKANFPVLLGGDEGLNKSYRINGFPGFYVLGADGRVIGFEQNSNMDRVRARLNEFVQKAAGAGGAAKEGAGE
jgi:peroxiredoxin